MASRPESYTVTRFATAVTTNAADAYTDVTVNPPMTSRTRLRWNGNKGTGGSNNAQTSCGVEYLNSTTVRCHFSENNTGQIAYILWEREDPA